jgi:hypothetical protein
MEGLGITYNLNLNWLELLAGLLGEFYCCVSICLRGDGLVLAVDSSG